MFLSIMCAGYTIEWTAATLVHLSALQSVGEPTDTSVGLLVVRNHAIIEVSVQCGFMNWNWFTCPVMISWCTKILQKPGCTETYVVACFPRLKHGLCIVGNYEMKVKIQFLANRVLWVHGWIVNWLIEKFQDGLLHKFCTSLRVAILLFCECDVCSLVFCLPFWLFMWL